MARATVLQSVGYRFESDMVHHGKSIRKLATEPLLKSDEVKALSSSTLLLTAKCEPLAQLVRARAS